jgi:hypothetical protein
MSLLSLDEITSVSAALSNSKRMTDSSLLWRIRHDARLMPSRKYSYCQVGMAASVVTIDVPLLRLNNVIF